MTKSDIDYYGGCSCHTLAPCAFCTNLTSLEANAFAKGGMDGLLKFIELRDGEGPFHLLWDTETTGRPVDYRDHTHPDTPRLVELAAVLCHDDSTIVEELYAIVKPDGWVISEEVSKIHGITQEHAEQVGEPAWRVLWKFDRMAARAHFMGAHNHSFDRLIMKGEHHRLGVPHKFRHARRMCTMNAGTGICRLPKPSGKGLKWPTLQELHTHLFGEAFEGAHGAHADMMAMMRCYFHMHHNNLFPPPKVA